MSLWLSTLPLWLSGFLVVVVGTGLAMLGPIIVRRSVSLERLVTNNEVAGFKYAVLGVVYAVLLGFAVIVVWEKFRDAEAAVTDEAGAAAILYRLTNGLEPDARARVRESLSAYLQAAIDDDWPAMARGALSPTATGKLTGVYDAVLTVQPSNPRDIAVYSEFFHQLNALTTSRRTRLVLASGILPPVLWAALSVGAFVTICFTFFFGTSSLRAQTMMTGMIAVLIFMAMFVVVAIDHPFSGPVSVRTEALEYVLRDLGGVR